MLKQSMIGFVSQKPRDVATTLGEFLRQHRKQRSMTQAKLADCVGVSVRYMGDIERGRRLPSLVTLVKIGAELDISLDHALSLPWPPEPLPPETERTIKALVNAPAEALALLSDVLDAIERHAGVFTRLEAAHWDFSGMGEE